MSRSPNPGINTKQGFQSLGQQVQNWPTPTAMDPEEAPELLAIRAARMKAKHTGKNGTTHSGNGVGATLGTAVRSWPTPDVPNGGRGLPKGTELTEGSLYTEAGRKVQIGLQNAVMAWLTPHANCQKGVGEDGREGGLNIQTAVESWPTPVGRDSKGVPFSNREGGASLPEVVNAGQPDQEKTLMTGNTPAQSRSHLNPAWVSQLMGIDLEMIFFVPWATQ